MKDNHTPGPWKVHNHSHFNKEQWLSTLHGAFDLTHNGAGNPAVIACSKYSAMTDEENLSNARLITAAANSYDKHCGDRAVECAEGDLLGECLEVLDALDLFTLEVDRGLNKIENLKHIVSAANKVLAKTKGE